jgi:hypothetical protein
MFSISKNFIRVNDTLFHVKRTFLEERIKNVDAAKELFGCTHVFKKDEMLYFTEEVPEAQTTTE